MTSVARPCAIDAETLARINRHCNLLPKPPERRYAFAYIEWLKGGAVGVEPSPVRVSKARAEELRDEIQEFSPWENSPCLACGASGGHDEGCMVGVTA